MNTKFVRATKGFGKGSRCVLCQFPLTIGGITNANRGALWLPLPSSEEGRGLG